MEAVDHRDRLASFVVRARRILAAPLAQDDAQLARASEIKFEMRQSGGYIRLWLPDEHALESLAARVRPLLLAQDPVYYAKAFASLGYLVRSVPAAAQLIKEHRKLWDRLVQGQESRFYLQQLGPEGWQVERAWRDRAVAEAWFYGDLIHADADHQEATRDLSFETRFHAAFNFIADIVKLLWRSVGLVYLHRPLLALPDWAWSTPVSVQATAADSHENQDEVPEEVPGGRWWERPADAYIAEPGVAPPRGELTDEWQRLGPEPPDILRHLVRQQQPGAAASASNSVKDNPV